MKQKKLAKIFMVILNWKKHIGPYGLYKKISASFEYYAMNLRSVWIFYSFSEEIDFIRQNLTLGLHGVLV